MSARSKFLDFVSFMLREAPTRGFRTFRKSWVRWLDHHSLCQSSILTDFIHHSVSLISYLSSIQGRSYGTLFLAVQQIICTFQPGATNSAVKVSKSLPDWDVGGRRHSTRRLDE